MSITLVKPYFSTKCTTAGFEEWLDGFGDDNIPSTLLDRAFHQRVISVDGRGINQETIEFVVTHEVKVFFKGFDDPMSAIDQSLVDCQSLIVSIINIADVADANIKGVFFESMSIDPFDNAVNDNIIIATLRFSVRVYNCLA